MKLAHVLCPVTAIDTVIMENDSFRVRVHFVKDCLLFVIALAISGIAVFAFALSRSYATKMEAGRNSRKAVLHHV